MTTDKFSLHPLPGKLCNGQRWLQKSITCQNAELWSLDPMDISSKHSNLRLRELQDRGQKDCKSQRFREFAVRLCLLVMSEVIASKSQHDCLKVSQTRMTTDMPQWVGKGHEAQPCTKICRQLKKQERWPSPGKGTSICSQMASP